MLDGLAYILSLILQPCYQLTGNWWAAIALFTLATKVVLMPLSLWSQHNSIVLVKLMPQINRLKASFFGDREAIGERQNALYKQHGYHPLLNLVPLILQIVILVGLVTLVHDITESGAPGTELLGRTPITDGGITWAMPVLAGLSAVVLGWAQNHINPLQREQSRREQFATNALAVALALVLGVFVGAGLAFYWICSNLSSILVQLACNAIIRPGKHIDYDDLAASRRELEDLETRFARKRSLFSRDSLAKREKADYRRFNNVLGKHLVFYSEGGSFYRYYQGAIEWLLDNSDVNIHYVTNDPDDAVFALAKDCPRLLPYYISEQRAITLMMRLDADVCASTLNQLDSLYIKRSYLRKDIEYVYLFHHMTSTTMVPPQGSYDHYDTILCTGPHQIPEIREAEAMHDLPAKKLVKCGYDLLDRQIAGYAATSQQPGSPPVVLVAPSWQEDNLLDLCFEGVVGPLLAAGMRVRVRPHPEYVKRNGGRWQQLHDAYANESLIVFEDDLASGESVFTSDVVVTDWSSIGCEFSFATLKPTLFVNTPLKAHNPEWQSYSMQPVDITLRTQIGTALDVEQLPDIAQVVQRMVDQPETWRRAIESARDATLFNLGSGGQAAGQYLLSAVLAAQERRAAAGDGAAGMNGTAGADAAAAGAARSRDAATQAAHGAATPLARRRGRGRGSKAKRGAHARV